MARSRSRTRSKASSSQQDSAALSRSKSPAASKPSRPSRAKPGTGSKIASRLRLKPSESVKSGTANATSSLIPSLTRLDAAELATYLLTFLSTASPSVHLYPSWSRFFFFTSLYMFLERIILTHLGQHPPILNLLPSTAPQLIRMYRFGFTRIIIFWMIASSLHRPMLEPLWAAASVSSWAALTSFHAVLLVDSKAHARLAAHVGVPLPAFSAGNLIVHAMPCLASYLFPPSSVPLISGVVAMAAQCTWGVCYTHGTPKGLFVLDDIYAECPAKVWHALWVVAAITNIVVPFFF